VLHQVEREIGQPLGLAANDGVLQPVNVGHAALVGNGYLAVERHRLAHVGQDGVERRPELSGAVEAVAGDQP
jgi:hypothetical protein